MDKDEQYVQTMVKLTAEAVVAQRQAARLQARATVYAALHTAPRAKEKGLGVDDLVRDAVAIVAALEAAS